MSTLAAPNGYSSIFASGLLATPRPARTQSGSHTPSRPSSPIGMDVETTPTALRTIFSDFTFGSPNPTFGSPNPSLLPDTDDDAPHSRSRASSVASTSSTSGAPRLRRRKSSLTVGTTTLSSIKSPLRTARAAASVSRARGGSLSAAGFELEVPPMTMEHEPPMTAPICGRMRSGSLGHALRPRRTVRKPAAAPPNVPLPPPPVTGFGIPAERRPLAHRAHTSDNFSSFAHVGGHLHKGMALDSPVDGVFWDGGNSMKEN